MYINWKLCLVEHAMHECTIPLTPFAPPPSHPPLPLLLILPLPLLLPFLFYIHVHFNSLTAKSL